MLQVNHIDHINILVKSLEETIQFYDKHFGFKVHQEGISTMTNNPYSIIGISGKILICAYQISTNSEFKISGIGHIGIHIHNFDNSISYLNDQKLPLLYGGIITYENSRSMYIADPSGYEIELSEKFGGGL